MLYASGNTFPHKEDLKSLGGRWDNAGKRWQFDWSTQRTRDALAKMVGVVVTGDTDNLPSVSIETDDDNTFTDVTELVRKISSRETPKQLTRDGRTAVYGDDDRFLNYFRDQNPTAFFGFSSLGKLIDHVNQLDKPYDSGRSRGWSTYQERWFGTPNMYEALKLARDGWLEGLEGVEALDIPSPLVPRRMKAVAGGSVNVGRLLSGDPRHMNARPKQPGRKTVTFFVETFMSAGVSPENAIIRARLVAAMADAMERQGYSCEIVAVLTTSAWARATGHQAAVTLKASGERLNLLDVVFGLGHPSFFRRLMFACVGAADECESTWSCQGSPTTAFATDHPTRKNEFYVKQLSMYDQDEVDPDDPLTMLPFIKPEGLPI